MKITRKCIRLFSEAHAVYKTVGCRFSTVSEAHGIPSEIYVPHTSYLKIVGKDTRKFLQGLCTNDVNSLKPNTSMATAFLNTKGRILADVILYDFSKDSNEQEILLEVSEKQYAGLERFLKMYKLRSAIKFENPLSLRTIIRTSGESNTSPDCIFQSVDPRSSVLGFRMICKATNQDNQSFSETNMIETYTRFRYLNGLAEGNEIADHIPLEVNLDLLNYISFSKGCYIGQELIARTKYKGLIRKRLVPFHVQSVTPNENRESFSFIDANYGSPPSSFQIPVGTNIFDKNNESADSVGKIVAYNQSSQLGLAIMRLDTVFKANQRIVVNEFDGHSGEISLTLFKPKWWPDIDPQTGKQLNHVD